MSAFINNRLFPKDAVANAFAGLNAWTSIADICRAARIMEGRLSSLEEPPQGFICAAVPDNPLVERFYEICLRQFSASFRCPGPKIVLAMYEDPQIAAQTRQRLRSVRARPIFSFQSESEVRQLGTLPAESPTGRYIVLHEKPHIIELIYRPFCTLRFMGAMFLEAAWRIAELKQHSRETSGGEPNIYHKPNGDSPLPCLVEAIAYHLAGHHVGAVSLPAKNIDIAFRNVAVTGHPPFPSQLVDVARDVQRKQFEELSND